MINEFLPIFLQAIDIKSKVLITFTSKEKAIITRTCIPFDFGPSQRKDSIDKTSKYHVLDLDSPEKVHNLPISPDKIIKIELTQDFFEPSQYITWTPKWIYPRDWGNYS